MLAVQDRIAGNAVWHLTISDDQVNGWLAAVLPAKFPTLLPEVIRDPRLEFRTGEVELACRYWGPRFSAVASVVVQPSLTDQPDVLAVRIRKAQLGAWRGLKRRLVQHLSGEARRAGIQLNWTQWESDPVALVTIAPPQDSDGRKVDLHTLQVQDGQLTLTGQIQGPSR